MRFRHALALIDAANADDPNEIPDRGRMRPAELVYGERMSAALDYLYPRASELLALAARAQHVRRWTVPRSDYSEGRAGYLRWRSDLKRRHGEIAGRILAQGGYAQDEIARVQALIRKERLKSDAETQALEDTACHVFLEHHLSDFAEKHEAGKVVTILRKTCAKMSETGRQAALALTFEPQIQALVEEALEGESGHGTR